MAGEYIEFNNNTQPAINDTNLNLMQQLIKQDIQGTVSGDTLPVGTIVPFGSDTIPENWLLCDGSAVSRTTYQVLFNTIGTSYGQGDGFTTFNLPDLRGRVGVGKSSDTEFDTLGETGGEKTHTLTVQEMPNFELNVNVGDTNYATVNSAYSGANGWEAFNVASAVAEGAPLNVKNTNGGQPHNNLQPYIVTNYIIKATQSAGVVATVVDNLNSNSSTNALSAKQGKILNETINDKSTYSTSETVVGTWIDGKPLYRKVITTTNTISNDTVIAHGISNVNLIYIKNAFMFNPSGQISWQLPIDLYGTTETSTDRVGVAVGTNNIIFKCDTSWGNAWTKYVVLEYTKTTD